MSLTKQEETLVATNSRELEELINKAMTKVDGKKEKDLCRYIPMPTGGYMHHFTMKKMKNKLPAELSGMLREYIVDVDHPEKVPPKPRAARGSRKKRDQIILTKDDIDRILQIARTVGDDEVVRKLMPKKDLKTIQRELIAAIRRCEIDQELWRSYVQAAQHVHDTEAAS